MRVSDVMTRNVACCTPETSLLEVARLMVDHDSISAVARHLRALRSEAAPA